MESHQIRAVGCQRNPSTCRTEPASLPQSQRQSGRGRQPDARRLRGD